MIRTRRLGFMAAAVAVVFAGSLLTAQVKVKEKVVEKAPKGAVVEKDVIEKDVVEGRAVEGRATADNVAHYRAKQILGAKVSLDENAPAGTVDDIVLDANGNVDYLIVANEDGKLFTVPWDAAAFNAEKRVANIHITQQQFQQVPTYTAEQYPHFYQPAYRTQVYKYYGLTPGQERRTIRRATR